MGNVIQFRPRTEHLEWLAEPQELLKQLNENMQDLQDIELHLLDVYWQARIKVRFAPKRAVQILHEARDKCAVLESNKAMVQAVINSIRADLEAALIGG